MDNVNIQLDLSGRNTNASMDNEFAPKLDLNKEPIQLN